MIPKDKVITSLQTAQVELDKALEQLARMPAYDASRVRFAAHTLNNYLAVTGGCAELLQMTLGERADEQTKTWLEGLRHATGLMTHIVVQLLNIPTADGEALIREKVNLQTLTDRACDYYRHSASLKQITIVTEPAATAPSCGPIASLSPPSSTTCCPMPSSSQRSGDGCGCVSPRMGPPPCVPSVTRGRD